MRTRVENGDILGWTLSNVFVPLHVCINVKLICVHWHLYNSWKGCNYLPVEFYFFKLYHQGDNIFYGIEQIAPSVSHNQCVSVFCVIIFHNYFAYIFAKHQHLTPWNIVSFHKENCFSSVLFLPISQKWNNTVAHFTLPNWCIFVLE